MGIIGLGLSVILGFVPMFFLAAIIFWLDRYEKEPKLLLGGVFAWGAVVAVIGALILELIFGQGVLSLTGSTAFEEIFSSALSAPITEEILKGAAVFIVFLFFRNEFDSVLDGIVYASITALGFAATEDVLYYFGGFLDSGIRGIFSLFFLRFVVFGWQHAFFTSFTGIGLAVARLNRNTLVKVAAPLFGLSLAILAHSVHNTLLTIVSGFAGLVVGALLAWTGWIIMFFFILILIFGEKRTLGEQLKEEVSLGVISARQYQVACSIFGQSISRISALSNGTYRVTDRFYQVCGEISLKKKQLVRLGDESGNLQIIQKLRAELSRLSPIV